MDMREYRPFRGPREYDAEEERQGPLRLAQSLGLLAPAVLLMVIQFRNAESRCVSEPVPGGELLLAYAVLGVRLAGLVYFGIAWQTWKGDPEGSRTFGCVLIAAILLLVLPSGVLLLLDFGNVIALHDTHSLFLFGEPSDCHGQA
ncbi:hypothetical protein [Yinghuangia soli]|uniref:Uncharacterized protein n=1 Tax=Yinghuangia soli TaxID=2908204 RepID=A0AA41U6Z9_9ACTN|nr:hypothetical protein [Yinghuangia soli]MCF2533552.1 hypothetical protein [Yinghuangia soli]